MFLGGNDFPKRFHNNCHIAEIGFGTGLNLCVLLNEWLKYDFSEPLYFTSFEAFPLHFLEAQKALSPFKGMDEARDIVLSGFQRHEFSLNHPRLKAQVIIGDARKTLKNWKGKADAWFLDGFSPAKNPELWGAELMKHIYQHTKDGGTCATYTAAGHARLALKEAGFHIERVKGYRHKRHMSKGVKHAAKE